MRGREQQDYRRAWPGPDVRSGYRKKLAHPRRARRRRFRRNVGPVAGPPSNHSIGALALMNTSRLGAAILMTAMGCTGSIGDPSGSSARRGGSNGGFPTTGECQEDVPLVTAARRLTRSQYANILRDLRLDAKGTAADQLPVDDAGDDVAPDPRSMIVSS